MPNNKHKIWCLERTRVGETIRNSHCEYTFGEVVSYWATDHWIDYTTEGCTLMTERAAKVLCTEYKSNKADKSEYRVRRI